MFVRNAVGSLTLAVFVYPMSQELGWSRTLIGGAASLGGLLSIIGAPPVGWAVDRFGARLVLTIAVLLLGLSTISLAWVTTALAFYLAYGLARVLFTVPIPIGASVVVARWFVRKRGRATGILAFSHAGGMILFPAIASLVIQLRGWQEAWFVMGILVLVIALVPVALLIIQRPLRAELKSKIEGVRTQRQNELGCNHASLYRRFHQAGLTEVKMFSQLAVFTPATDGARLDDVQDRFLHVLDAEELEEYRAALDQAFGDGSFFIADWFHCAVGTNPG